MWLVMAHHLSTEQLNVNSMFTAAASTAASTPSHSCAPAWLTTSFAGSLPPPLSTQSALAVRSGLPPPASHGDAIPPKLSSNMSHVKNRCNPHLPADRARFLRHRRVHSPGTQAIRVSSASRSGIRAHRRTTSHLRARYHGKDPPLNSRPCGPFSFVAVTLSVLLAAASSILRPTKRRIFAEERIAMASSPNTAPATVTSPRIFLPMLHFGAPTRPSTRPDTSNDRIRAEERIAITSPPSMTPTWVSSLSMGLPFRLRTTSSSTRLPTCSPQSNKRDASMKTPTKGRILLKEGNSPDETSLNVTIHESPDASPRRRLRLDIPPAPIQRLPAAALRQFPTAAQMRCAADLSIPPARQPQSIHYPGFDVFMDDARNDHTTDEAFDAETTNISAPGRDQEQEKENIGRGIP
ncbi:hypothetical protein B0H14DRAFT_2649863 [Mycena olivaceomarginata]|nr:hypothetical protein B0H14DRAFT_2649863 [Mycena olivaceomarginata]